MSIVRFTNNLKIGNNENYDDCDDDEKDDCDDYGDDDKLHL